MSGSGAQIPWRVVQGLMSDMMLAPPPESRIISVVERTWNKQAIQGQILALA